MADTAARLLALLSLLQAGSDWSGTELAERLGVTDRTVRNDIDRLRGARLPGRRGPRPRRSLPARRRREAAAAAAGRRRGRGGRGRAARRHRRCRASRRRSARALAKLEQVLPHRLRRQVNALQGRVERGRTTPARTSRTPRSTPACSPRSPRDPRPRRLRFDYRGERLEIEPYRLVSWQRRWYLVARDADAGDWRRTGSTGWRCATPAAVASPRTRCRARTTPTFVLREVASTGWSVHARITWTRRPRRCWPGSTPRSAWSRRVDDGTLRARHRRRQRRDHRGLHRDARPRLPRDRAAGAGRARGAGRRSLPAGRHNDFWNSSSRPITR